MAWSSGKVYTHSTNLTVKLPNELMKADKYWIRRDRISKDGKRAKGDKEDRL